MVPIKIFSSDQYNAPTCAGTHGYLDAILYACLVNGYNTQTISSISVTANVATATCSGTHHYSQYDIIKISGCTGTSTVFNDSFTILTVPDTTHFTFAITTTLGSAAGSPVACIAPLGWERTYTGTDKSVYRSTDNQGTQIYLRVVDTNANYTSLTMYETMTSIDIGLGASTTVYWIKSNASDTTARVWYLVGDSKRFYLQTHWYASYPTLPSIYFFGDIIKWRTTDSYHCALTGASDPSLNYPSAYCGLHVQNTSVGNWLARSGTQLITNVSFLLCTTNCGSYNPTGWGYASGILYPNQFNNSVNLFPVYVFENTPRIYRGTLPGFYVPAEDTNGIFVPKDRSIVKDGKTYMALRSSAGYSLGNFFLDITGPWQ